MKSDVITWLRIVVEGAGMRVILRTQLELGVDQSTQKREERLRSIEVEESWSLLHHGIVADAATFLMAWYIVSIELPLDALRLWNEEIFDHRSRKKLLHVEEFVLFPVLAMKSVDIERRDRPFNSFQNWTHCQSTHWLVVAPSSISGCTEDWRPHNFHIGRGFQFKDLVVHPDIRLQR